MRAVLFAVGLLSLSVTTLPAKPGESAIALADVALLSDSALQQLDSSELAVFKTQVKLARAQHQVNVAREELRGADRLRDTKELDLRAAKAEVKAAQANVALSKDAQTGVAEGLNNAEPEQQARLSSADTELQNTQRAIANGEALVNWKRAQLEAAETTVRTLEIAVEAAALERDKIRAEALAREQPAGIRGKYSAQDFAKRLERTQRNYQKQEERRVSASAKAEQARAKYQ